MAVSCTPIQRHAGGHRARVQKSTSSLWRAKCYGKYAERKKIMFLTLFAVLLVLWLLGFFAFHVAGGLIHLLLIVAVICLVLNFVRRA